MNVNDAVGMLDGQVLRNIRGTLCDDAISDNDTAYGHTSKVLCANMSYTRGASRNRLAPSIVQFAKCCITETWLTKQEHPYLHQKLHDLTNSSAKGKSINVQCVDRVLLPATANNEESMTSPPDAYPCHPRLLKQGNDGGFNTPWAIDKSTTQPLPARCELEFCLGRAQLWRQRRFGKHMLWEPAENQQINLRQHRKHATHSTPRHALTYANFGIWWPSRPQAKLTPKQT